MNGKTPISEGKSRWRGRL